MAKILHLLYSGIGGTSSVVFSLIEADKKKKLDQSILFIGPILIKDFIMKSQKLKINYSWIKTIKFIYFSSYISVFNQLIRNKPDVIFIHNYYSIPCIFYKLFFRKTKIFYINHLAPNLFNWKDLMMKSLHIFYDKLILLNKESYDFVKKKFSISKKKITLISNGINTNFFRPILVKKNFFKIGMACRLVKTKRYDLILNSINSSYLNQLNIKFSLAGTGEDLANFKKRVKKIKTKKNVEITGYLNEISLKKWYASLDLYIQASDGEAMPTSLLQAMSMGIPVIGSRVPGISNFLGKKNIGKLFNNNIKDLANKIKFFYFANKLKKKQFIIAQRNYILSKHTHIQIFKKYLYEIKTVL
jgi:glycosyltransferase involved in cell wall biosynthesis